VERIATHRIIIKPLVSHLAGGFFYAPNNHQCDDLSAVFTPFHGQNLPVLFDKNLSVALSSFFCNCNWEIFIFYLFDIKGVAQLQFCEPSFCCNCNGGCKACEIGKQSLPR